MERSLVRSIYRFRQLRARFDVLRSTLAPDERDELVELTAQLKNPAPPRGDQTDRREFHRFEIPAVPVELEASKTWIATELLNLSGGGFAVRAVAGVARGSFVRLRVTGDVLTRY